MVFVPFGEVVVLVVVVFVGWEAEGGGEEVVVSGLDGLRSFLREGMLGLEMVLLGFMARWCLRSWKVGSGF
ncbi:hypothetical protein BKA64DRAFT_682116 [Cadophora sp. MPI-SDFR-AT-0126]|nr:hypothetical protein BKA64DRAFT_682116 [Leotiomycetes sp. MPI-SDFR-AT-0126]